MSRRQNILDLRNGAPQILPSFLQCDFGDLRSEVQQLEAASVKCLHLDVMDGHFVPNLTYGMPIVSGLRKHTQMPLDVHLMISNPEQYIDQFYEAGADAITIHVEAVDDAGPLLRKIRDLDVASGLALNPDTPLSAIEPYLDDCDLVLPMSVNAGFGGQKFNPVALEKLRELRKLKPDLLLEVDGGVNPETIADCVNAGAELLVVGSAIFKHDNYGQALDHMYGLLD